jgi:hypothetical protein
MSSIISTTNNNNDNDTKKILDYYRNYINGDNQQFERYNSVSISHLLIPMSGLYGDEPKELAIKLMKKFVVWYKSNKPDNYFPDGGCQQMYPLSSLVGSITISEEYTSIEPKERLKLINNLINESQKSVKQVTLQEHMNKKKLKGDKMVNVMALGGGAFIGWALTKLFLK